MGFLLPHIGFLLFLFLFPCTSIFVPLCSCDSCSRLQEAEAAVVAGEVGSLSLFSPFRPRLRQLVNDLSEEEQKKEARGKMLQGGKNEVSQEEADGNGGGAFLTLYGYTGTAAGICAEIAR